MTIEAAIILYYGTLTFLPLLLWRSRKNVAAVLKIPLFLIAYFGGAFYFVDLAGANYGVDRESQDLYAALMLSGTVIFLLAYVYGFAAKGRMFFLMKYFVFKISPNNIDKVLGMSSVLAIFSITLFVISFWGMGFIPMLSEDPMSAKFMVGEYKEHYTPFAIPYRVAINLSNVALLLIFTRLLKKRSLAQIVLAVVLVVCLALSLRRGMVLSSGIVVLFSYYAFQGKVKYGLLMGGYVVVYCFGSAFNDMFFYYLGLSDRINFIAILRGLPDIADQLWFTHRWINDHWDYTYGANLIGGLIPYNSEYNISVLSQNVVGVMVGEATTGGFRLPIVVIGYISFGWSGVIILSILHAYLSGNILRCMKEFLSTVNNVETFIIYNSLVYSVLMLITGIMNGLKIDELFNVCVILLLLFLSKYKLLWGEMKEI